MLSVSLALEHEAVCRDPAQRIASGLSEEEVSTVVSALCAVCEPVDARYLWRPQLRDPADADIEAARRPLRRPGGQPPEPEDRLP